MRTPTLQIPLRLTAGLLAALIALCTCTAAAHAAYDPADPAQKAQYDAALALASQGYEYGVPVLNMQRTFSTSTSVNVPNGRGGGSVNRFSHFEKLADAKDRTVVAPNADTLYSMAWLDLSREPVVVRTVKGTTRFHVLELLSPWEENFANVGSPRTARADGDYLVTGPGYRGRTPRGLKRIASPQDRVWIIGRTYVNGAADVKAARAVMDGYRITPLSRWDPRHPAAYTPPRPHKVDRTINTAQIPGTAPGQDAATFFDALGDQLRRFPPPRRDAPILKRLKTLGIGPGLHPATAGKLTGAQLQALRDAVIQGPNVVQGNLIKTYLAGFDAHNGWLVGRTGTYGTDYRTRAVVDKVGLGAPRPEVSVYPLTLVDRDKGPLTGAKRFVAHFPAAHAKPPVSFFWSMTLYDNDGFFVDNPLNRYLVNDRSGLRHNADGSLDVYLQPDAPVSAAQRANWLPIPQPGAAQPAFRLMVRLYGLSAAAIRGVVDGSGWQAPTVLPCLADNRTREGVACAS